MSTFSAVCDAWKTELQTNVTGLDTTTIPANHVHLYAPWSTEFLEAFQNERHLAIWPESEPEVANGWVAGDPPEDLSVQTYVISVWEDASAESTRRYDDDTANAAWLTLYEAVRTRLYVRANQRLGAPTGLIKYQGGAFALDGTTRVLALRFALQLPLPYS